MGRSRKPAIVKQGKSETKEHLRRRAEIEQMLKGNDDEVYSTPEYFTEEEKIYYKWLVDELKELNILSNLDKPLLEQTANCIWIMRKCDDEIRANGIIVPRVDRYGNTEDRENPAIKIKLNFQTKYTTLCNQLGLSPSARAAIADKQMMSKQEEQDPLMQLIKGGI